MPIKVSAYVAVLMAASAATATDGGSTAGLLTVYSGTQPATPDTAVTDQVALVEFELADPAFGAPVDGASEVTVTASPVDPVVAAVAGTASWFRITDSDGEPVIDGDVTDTSGTGSMKISTTAITVGTEVSVVSLTFIMPKAEP